MKFIFTSDWHIRADRPRCRVDDFLKTQDRKLGFLQSTAKSNGAPILVAGDVFDKAKSTQRLERWTINKIPNHQIITVAGNHDLPYHSINQYQDSSLAVLESSSYLDVLNVGDKGDGNLLDEDALYFASERIAVHGLSWGRDLDEWIEKAKANIADKHRYTNIALMHIYAYNIKKYWDEGEVALEADYLMRKLDMFDIIVTGHNHIPFVRENKGRYLVNPGSITRQKSDDNFRPRIYIWDSSSNKVNKEYIPVIEEAISLEYAQREKDEKRRLDELAEKFGLKLEENMSHTLNDDINFLKELDAYYSDVAVNDEVKDKITDWMAQKP